MIDLVSLAQLVTLLAASLVLGGLLTYLWLRGRISAAFNEGRLFGERDNQERLEGLFKGVASDALRHNNQIFLDLAKAAMTQAEERTRKDHELSSAKLAALLQPVGDALQRFDHSIGVIEKARLGAYEGLKEHLRSLNEGHTALRSETQKLSAALKSPNVRGMWGEIQLKRVVELAGMLDHCDFYEQKSSDSDSGKLRPDLVVRLPGERHVVVDAKAPLAAYLAAHESSDDSRRQLLLREHAQKVKEHIRRLSQKSYWDQFQPAPEFVVMFLPGEAFYSAALEHDPELIEYGVNQKVILATPTTLIALLRAVAYGWRHERLAKNAKEISQLGSELYKRLVDFGGHVGRLGKALGQAVDSYNKTVGSLESRVLVTSRKLRDLDAATSDELAVVEPLDSIPREFSARELSGPDAKPAVAEMPPLS